MSWMALISAVSSVRSCQSVLSDVFSSWRNWREALARSFAWSMFLSRRDSLSVWMMVRIWVCGFIWMGQTFGDGMNFFVCLLGKNQTSIFILE